MTREGSVERNRKGMRGEEGDGDEEREAGLKVSLHRCAVAHPARRMQFRRMWGAELAVRLKKGDRSRKREEEKEEEDEEEEEEGRRGTKKKKKTKKKGGADPAPPHQASEGGCPAQEDQEGLGTHPTPGWPS
ncbi:unnamed protein product [Prorocentrum cordatum]|uniref:Uncharacterized protein n=1 Tax=Prorocentrum cordatum TaxID=2364126 RepID=A0ABN9RPZ5_9DINO|nr:unnamed protein product [Polarella glacialis]